MRREQRKPWHSIHKGKPEMLDVGEHWQLVGKHWVDIEKTIRQAGGSGDDAKEQIDSLQGRISDETRQTLHKLRIQRNALIHGNTPLPDTTWWEASAKAVTATLAQVIAAPLKAQLAQVPPLGTLSYQRFQTYKDHDTFNIGPLLKSGSFKNFVEQWEQASGLRYVDENLCRRDLEHWVRFSANAYVLRFATNSGIDAQLNLASAVGDPSINFIFRPFTTPPSEKCRRLAAALEEIARRDPVIQRGIRVGIDSHYRESILVLHRGVKIKDGVFGINRFNRVFDQSLVSFL